MGTRTRCWLGSLVVAAAALWASACTGAAPLDPTPPAPTTMVRPAGTIHSGTLETFAIIGDFGTGKGAEAAVARLVASWNPAYVVAVGDVYYASAGGTGTSRYDESIGTYYCPWLANVTTAGARCPQGQAPTNAFFPAMGNHDYWDAGPSPDDYLTYFDLPGAGFHNTSGNERFYDFTHGPIHFFVLNSEPQEPAGTSSTSEQGQWLEAQLAASTTPWNIVIDHRPPYSSDATHGSEPGLQWPFAAWGADAVVSGHAHTYERIVRDGLVYFVNGLGGAPRYDFSEPLEGSAIRYAAAWGAQKVTVTPTDLTFAFYTVDGALIDSYSLRDTGA